MNEIFIYDEIGPDWMGMVGAKGIIDQLKEIGDSDVTVRINSPGGSVTEGQAIYNALLRHKGKVTIAVDSLAASMGSYIAMAGAEIEIAANAMIMIHNPWSIVMGSASEMRQAADVLEKFQGGLVETYVARCKGEAEEVQAWMDAETWMTASEAVERGFADRIGQELNVSASIKQGRYKNTPNSFLVGSLPREQKRASRIEQAQRQLRLNRARMGV